MNLVKWHTLALALTASFWLAGCSTTPSSSGDTHASASPSVNPAQGITPPTHIGSSQELRSGAVTSLRAPDDIWERIRRGYAMPDIDTALVRQQEDYYASRPEYIGRMTERARHYIFHIVEELELRDMPTELALLPFVESAFRPDATSSAKAAGIWQFMPNTGRTYDLRQNFLRDERRDLIASTRAALDYLSNLYGMFGDWHLALAAYNWGEGNVQKAIRLNRAAGLGESYLDLRMPNETRHYVPKLQAIKNIVSNPARFGGKLPHIGNTPAFKKVAIKHDIDVATAIRLAEVHPDDFRALNSAQRKPVIFAAGTPYILLPWHNAAIFEKNLRHTPVSELASWTAWVTPEKMRPFEIAQRFGMSEEEFRSMNSIPRGMYIAGGSTVLVHRSASASSTAAGSIVNSANARLSYVPEFVPRVPRAPSLQRTSVPVRKGDTLARIAARYDLPLSTVQRWNPGVKKLRAGQSIALHLPKRAASAKAGARKGVTLASAKAGKTAKNTKTSVKTADKGKAGNKASAKSAIKTAKADTKGKASVKTTKADTKAKTGTKTAKAEPKAKTSVKIAKAEPRGKAAAKSAAKPSEKSATKTSAKPKNAAPAKKTASNSGSGSVKVARARH